MLKCKKKSQGDETHKTGVVHSAHVRAEDTKVTCRVDL